MKKTLTSEQLYKRNQKWAKALKILTPICFWLFLALGVLFLFLAIRNSFGNVAEIIDKLDKTQYTGEQLQENYNELIEKYGEWIIGNGSAGFTISFINIKKAVFSGVMITSGILCIVFFISSYVLGKWLLPKLANQIVQENQDMVNLQVLKNADKK